MLPKPRPSARHLLILHPRLHRHLLLHRQLSLEQGHALPRLRLVSSARAHSVVAKGERPAEDELAVEAGCGLARGVGPAGGTLLLQVAAGLAGAAWPAGAGAYAAAAAAPEEISEELSDSIGGGSRQEVAEEAGDEPDGSERNADGEEVDQGQLIWRA